LKDPSCATILCSIKASFFRTASFVNISRRIFTNVRIIAMLTCTARSLFKTLDSIATPCSVKTKGIVRLPPRPLFDIAICDIKVSFSSLVS
jgi:hypothetical protein